MIAPNLVDVDPEDRVVKAKKIAIELHIDDYIRNAVFKGPFIVNVNPPPIGIQYNINGTEFAFKSVDHDIINSVLDQYRALGWTITGNGPWQFSK